MTTCPECNENIAFALPGPKLESNHDWVSSIIEKIFANAQSNADGKTHWPVHFWERWECPMCMEYLDVDFDVQEDGSITGLYLRAIDE